MRFFRSIFRSIRPLQYPNPIYLYYIDRIISRRFQAVFYGIPAKSGVSLSVDWLHVVVTLNIEGPSSACRIGRCCSGGTSKQRHPDIGTGNACQRRNQALCRVRCEDNSNAGNVAEAQLAAGAAVKHIERTGRGVVCDTKLGARGCVRIDISQLCPVCQDTGAGSRRSRIALDANSPFRGEQAWIERCIARFVDCIGQKRPIYGQTIGVNSCHVLVIVRVSYVISPLYRYTQIEP